MRDVFPLFRFFVMAFVCVLGLKTCHKYPEERSGRSAIGFSQHLFQFVLPHRDDIRLSQKVFRGRRGCAPTPEELLGYVRGTFWDVLDNFGTCLYRCRRKQNKSN